MNHLHDLPRHVAFVPGDLVFVTEHEQGRDSIFLTIA